MRARYWEEAIKIHGQPRVLGAGAGAYGQLRLRYRVNRGVVRHAHGYVVQMLADLGWVGLGLSLLAAWRVVRRGRGARARRAPRATAACPGTPNAWAWRRWRVVVIVFGVHSAIDWTWYVPGNAVPALLCAGFVASRTTAARAPRRRRAAAPDAAPSVRACAPPRGRRSCW